MAISMKQRKSIGRRYSTDPAMDMEMARLDREYALAPARAAMGMQVSENEKSRAQSESQFSRNLEQSRTLSEKQSAQQNEQYYAGLEQAKAQQEAALKLATDNYNLAVKNAKSDQDYRDAALIYQKEKDAADRAYMEERDKAAGTSAMYGTIGNTAIMGAMLRATTKGKGEPFFGDWSNTFGTKTTPTGGGGIEAGSGFSGQIGGTTPAVTPDVMPITTPQVIPAATDTYAGAGATGGGIESGVGFGGQIGAGSAYGGGVTGSGAELYGGLESGLGFSGEIGAETAGSTLGSTLGGIGSGISTAAPYYALAKGGGMLINSIVANNPQFQNTPFSRLGGSLQEPLAVERYWANQAADIGIGDYKTNTIIADILNPVGWLVNRTWICTEISKKEPLSEDVNESLSKLRRYAIKNHKEDARAYLVKGFLLIQNIALDLDSLKDELVKKCCDLVKEDKMEEAFNHYKDVVLRLCEENGFDVSRLYEEVT